MAFDLLRLIRGHWQIGSVFRGSTAGGRASHPLVAEALQYIIANASKPINANDVVRHTGASRAWLSKLFQSMVGHSIADELMKVRINQAKHLLLSTDLKIGEVALRSGFTSYAHFAKSFQRLVGCSAGQFLSEFRSS